MGPLFALVQVIVVKFAGMGASVHVAVAAETEEDVVVVVVTITGAAVMEEELPVATLWLTLDEEDVVPPTLAPVARAILDT
jgi:hypothetical protein